MTLLTRLLELCYITSSVNRNCFNEDELENLAREILKSKGIINPIIVKQESALKFSVVEGDFEYYSAVKASEIDSRFEEIQALILPKDKLVEEGISNQVNILRKKSDPALVIPNNSEKLKNDRVPQLQANNTSSAVNFNVSTIEEIFEKQEQKITSNIERYLSDRFLRLENMIEAQPNSVTQAQKTTSDIDIGKYLNDYLLRWENMIEEKIRSVISQLFKEELEKVKDIVKAESEKAKTRRKRKISNEEKNININSASKEELMTIPGIAKSTAEKIIDRREKEGKFKNIDEVFACCKNASKTYKEEWRRVFVFD